MLMLQHQVDFSFNFGWRHEELVDQWSEIVFKEEGWPSVKLSHPDIRPFYKES